jgi:hypothetical protein
MLGPGVRVGRVEPVPEHARDTVRLLAQR